MLYTHCHSHALNLAVIYACFKVELSRGELSAVIIRLMSKCLWSGWKWYWGVKEIPSPFSCSPVIRKCSWKKSQIEKKYHLKWREKFASWSMNLRKEITCFKKSEKQLKIKQKVRIAFAQQEGQCVVKH